MPSLPPLGIRRSCAHIHPALGSRNKWGTWCHLKCAVLGYRHPVVAHGTRAQASHLCLRCRNMARHLVSLMSKWWKKATQWCARREGGILAGNSSRSKNTSIAEYLPQPSPAAGSMQPRHCLTAPAEPAHRPHPLSSPYPSLYPQRDETLPS